ncbi:hypothetical protein bthur0009_8230 [Bacillus thuringiensis serovar andalousiensis BGSC 4AW1]|nr:hypothetical protein bthur0009_8230 [Bacillus thuringiensis serovar andalousiensis BGSC 4AW1]
MTPTTVFVGVFVFVMFFLSDLLLGRGLGGAILIRESHFGR